MNVYFINPARGNYNTDKSLKKVSENTHSDQPHNNTALQTPIRLKQIITQCKEIYLQHWKEETKSQSRLEFYLALTRDYELSEYLSTVRDRMQRHILT